MPSQRTSKARHRSKPRAARREAKSVRVKRNARKRRFVSIAKLPERSFYARDRALKALRDMRRGASISQAAQGNAVSPRTIKRYVGLALVQDRPGARIRATKSDRLLPYLQIPGRYGPVEVTARGSR